MSKKRCCHCKEFFPATSEYFYSNRSTKDGFTPDCKQCSKTRTKRSHAEHREQRSESKRLHYQKNADVIKERSRLYRQNNPDKVRDSRRRHRLKYADELRVTKREYAQVNHERLNRYHRTRYAENPTPRKEAVRRYHEKNPQKKQLWTIERRARKKGLPDQFTEQDWQRALLFFEGRCAVCGRSLIDRDGYTAAADHWIPLSNPNCPGTIPTNIIPLCHGIKGCNNSKGTRNAAEWLTERYGETVTAAILARIQNYFASLEEG